MKRLLLIFLLLPLSLSSQTKIEEYDSYLTKIEDGQLITVFSEPGQNWRYCPKVIDPKTKKEICRDAIGWLDNQSKVRIVGNPEIRPVQDPITGEWINEEYVKVEFFYARLDENGELVTNMKSGYIEKYNVSNIPMTPFYAEQKVRVPSPSEPKPVPMPAPQKDCSQNAELKEIEKLCRPMKDALENLGVNDSAKILNEVVGFCATSPPNKFPKSLPTGNAYDALVYSKLKKKKVPLLKNENKEYITMEDVANVDAMARTLYGEMAQCYRYGLEYPMTVAKIIKNRASEDGKRYRSVFIQGDHSAGKSDLMKVATTPSQFSMWRSVKDNGPLHHGLCPPRELGKPFYRSKSASKFENDIWVNTMRIATEAVLFPTQFAKRTQDVTDFHYTSNLSRYKGTDKLPKGAAFIEKMTHVRPTIEGRKVNYNRCLEVWKM
tara:strand:- start:10818 stop:12122 length:1305 start_codon:yes stop_codon:yes gene_type:complete